MEVESPPSYPLIPLIFSHGLSSNRTMHSGLCRDLASHGYLVFAPDHMDRTSSYYETEDGQGYYYCNKRTAHDMEYRKGQLEMRVGEVRAIIDEISNEETREILQQIHQRYELIDGHSCVIDKLIMQIKNTSQLLKAFIIVEFLLNLSGSRDLDLWKQAFSYIFENFTLILTDLMISSVNGFKDNAGNLINHQDLQLLKVWSPSNWREKQLKCLNIDILFRLINARAEEVSVFQEWRIFQEVCFEHKTSNSLYFHYVDFDGYFSAQARLLTILSVKVYLSGFGDCCARSQASPRASIWICQSLQ